MISVASQADDVIFYASLNDRPISNEDNVDAPVYTAQTGDVLTLRCIGRNSISQPEVWLQMGEQNITDVVQSVSEIE